MASRLGAEAIGLGIDAGGSSTRWLLLDEAGLELGGGTLGPLTGHIFTPEGKAENLGRLTEVLRAALSVARPDAVVGGVTGLHGGTQAAALFQAQAREVLGLQSERALFDNDLHIAYASTFVPGAGVLLYAGTGSVSYHIAADGAVVRAGGYGYLIDDAGAGFWIGQQGLRQTFRWVDELGRPADTPLARAIYKALGSDDWDDIIGTVYGGGRSRVAALAPVVASAARAGDAAAVTILCRAGQELARLANAVLHRVGTPLPVAFAGGISKLSPVLTEALQTALPNGAGLETVSAEPVRAAAQLALELARRLSTSAATSHTKEA